MFTLEAFDLSRQSITPEEPRVAGKRTLTAMLAPRPRGEAPAPAPAAAPGLGGESQAASLAEEDPFAVHLAGAASAGADCGPPGAGPQSAGGGGESGSGEAPQTTPADMIQEGTTQSPRDPATGGHDAPGSGGAGGASTGAAASSSSAGPAAAPAPAATPGHPGAGSGGSAGRTGGGGSRSPAPTLHITGPRELWYFDGQAPPSYAISQALATNRTGGTFAWTCSAHVTLSSASGATPTVTAAAPSAAANDAWIRLAHTETGGATTTVLYHLTVKAPTALRHIRNQDTVDATYGYATFIHYSIRDQFGAVLPRSVPINEQFTAAPTADAPGMNWRTSINQSATVSPTDWNDWVQGETSDRTPTPVAPGAAGASTAVYHWPGHWYVGSTSIGSGRRVASVTWSKSRGHARHT